MTRTATLTDMHRSDAVVMLPAAEGVPPCINCKPSKRLPCKNLSQEADAAVLKKDFLSRYGDNEREITRLEEEICRWESRAAKVTGSFSHQPSHCGDDRIQSAVDEIVELRNILYDRLIDATELRRDIASAIAAVPEQRLRLLLEYRYIDGMTWEHVAAALTCDYRWTLRLHERAIAALPDLPALP